MRVGVRSWPTGLRTIDMRSRKKAGDAAGDCGHPRRFPQRQPPLCLRRLPPGSVTCGSRVECQSGCVSSAEGSSAPWRVWPRVARSWMLLCSVNRFWMTWGVELVVTGEQGHDDFVDDVFKEFSVELAGPEEEALAQQGRSGVEPAFGEG